MVLLSLRGRYIQILLFLCGAILANSTETPAQTSEYELKAALLYNFTQFVSWPQSAFASPDSPFQLCVAGEDPFGRTLDDVVTKETVNGHPIVVRRMQETTNADSCHIMYVSASSGIPISHVLENIKKRPVLLVGDAPDFALHGGTIALETIDRRIRMKVNLNAAREANLNISSKLLRVADVIGGDQ